MNEPGTKGLERPLTRNFIVLHFAKSKKSFYKREILSHEKYFSSQSKEFKLHLVLPNV